METPAPLDDQVLVRVRASSVNPADWYLAKGPFVARISGNGMLKPKSPYLGSDVSGVVESLGRNVQGFHPGDEVFGICRGAFAEYVTVPERSLVLKPANRSFEQAAAVPLAGLTALQGLRNHGNLRPGQSVLVHGASGGVGTFVVALAKLLGGEVTAVCSTDKVEIARSLGADRVLDYTKENFAEGAQRYDLIVVVNGHRPLRDYRRVLASGGRCVMIGGSIRQIIRVLIMGKLRPKSRQRGVRAFVMSPNKDDLAFLKELLETGGLTPVIDRTFPLARVGDAFRYMREGHARGKIAVIP